MGAGGGTLQKAFIDIDPQIFFTKLKRLLISRTSSPLSNQVDTTPVSGRAYLLLL